jgi:group I intron endonuclease
MKKKEINYGFIYLFTVSGKGYVGQTPFLKRRFKDHFRQQKSNPYFKRSLKKYFFKNGSFKILETWKKNNRTLEEFKKLLNNREIFWIQKLNTYDPKQKTGWNLTKGGEGSLGQIWSEKSRQKLRLARTGTHFSETTLKEMSVSRSGEKNANFGNRGENNPNFGKHPSEEILKKLRGENNHKNKLTEEQVREIRNSNLTQMELAKIYNIKQATISSIKLKKIWSWLE